MHFLILWSRSIFLHFIFLISKVRVTLHFLYIYLFWGQLIRIATSTIFTLSVALLWSFSDKFLLMILSWFFSINQICLFAFWLYPVSSAQGLFFCSALIDYWQIHFDDLIFILYPWTRFILNCFLWSLKQLEFLWYTFALPLVCKHKFTIIRRSSTKEIENEYVLTIIRMVYRTSCEPLASP